LSALTGSLTVMAQDLPPELRELAEIQCGIVSRSQVLAAGLTKDIVSTRLGRGGWQRMYPGIYAAFSGQPNRCAKLWAAVLSAGKGAVLSHQTAAELWRLADGQGAVIHLTVPSTRRVSQKPGIMLHLSARAAEAVHPARVLPRTRIEETVLDLWQTAASLDDAVGWVVSAIGRRLTTQEKLRLAMEARARLRWRQHLVELLNPDAAGLHSVLEFRYVRHVERPHGLPTATRQAHARRGGRNEYRDALYEAYQTAVELDGRVAHPADTRWRDIRRDNAAAATGITTLRYGWFEITRNPCLVAAQVVEVLAQRGYTGARPCSSSCPVGRAVQPRKPA
jgi:hypothetical protein